MVDSYKTSKEHFVSDGQGSTVLHINLISAISLASIVLFNVVTARYFIPNSLQFIFQFAILVLPILLSVTFAALNPIPTTALLLLVAGGFAALAKPVEKWNPAQALPARAPRLRLGIPAPEKIIPQLAAVSTYRAHLMVLTVICILAVDFTVFPRSLGKTETFGVSMMDLGVGSFVFAQGLTSSLPILKDPSYLSLPLLPKLKSSIRKTIPLIALGLVRVILVKGTNYPEHLSEYGTHWNFFLTLALLPPLQTLLHPLIMALPIPVIALTISTILQLLLSWTPLQHWALEAPRTSLISHNKEGITSLAGYLAIHLLGLGTGTIIFPATPSEFRRQHVVVAKQMKDNGDAPSTKPTKAREVTKTAVELSSYVVIWWTLFALSAFVIARPSSYVSELSLSGWGFSVSRRLANLPYVLWITAYNVLFLFCYLSLDIIFFPPSPPAPPIAPSDPSRSSSPSSVTSSSSLHPPLRGSLSRPASPSGVRPAGTRTPFQSSEKTDIFAAAFSTPAPQPAAASVLPPSAIAPAPAAVPSEPATPAALARVNLERAHSHSRDGSLSLANSSAGKRRSNENHREWEKEAERVIDARDVSIVDGRLQTAGTFGKAPELLEAINANGLGVFLLSNVLTGLMNLSIQTMYVTPWRAWLYLAAYSMIVCIVAWRVRGLRLLKF